MKLEEMMEKSCPLIKKICNGTGCIACKRASHYDDSYYCAIIDGLSEIYRTACGQEL